MASPSRSSRRRTLTAIHPPIRSPHPAAPTAPVLVTQRAPVLYAAGHGLADRKSRVPIDVDTAFHAGSVGKQFAALAVLMLVDDDRLALDDPIGAHLPELRKLGGSVTLRRLLGHTAGVPDVYHALYDVASAAYVARFPERDLMVAVLCNNADADPETVGLALAAAVRNDR